MRALKTVGLTATFLLFATPALAETSDMQAQITALIAQIQALQTQVAALQEKAASHPELDPEMKMFARDTSSKVMYAPQIPLLSFDSSTYDVLRGQVVTLSWNTIDANRCTLQDGTKKVDVPVDGSKMVIPKQTTSYRLACTDDSGSPPTEKTIVVIVSSPTVSYDGSEAVQVNTSSLYARPNAPFTITGSVSPSVTSIIVALVEIKYAGGTDWNSVGNVMKGGSGYLATSNLASISGGNWSVSFGGLPEGYYHIYMYDASYNLKGSGFMTATWKD